MRTGNQHGGATQRLQAVVSHADERYFARLVAKRWEVPLVERERMPSLDLRRMWHGPIKASPSAYFAVIDTEDVEIELAKTARADAFFSGHGGDSILLATTRPLAAVDYARLHGIRRGLWRHILADSRVSKKSLWTVLPLAAKHGLLRRPQPFPVLFLAQPNLLTKDATAMLAEEDFHSEWARDASNLPPGKQNHLSGLTCEPYFNSAFHRLKVADQVDVLNCQPVWETALQIPAYTMLCGANRGLAATCLLRSAAS